MPFSAPLEYSQSSEGDKLDLEWSEWVILPAEIYGFCTTFRRDIDEKYGLHDATMATQFLSHNAHGLAGAATLHPLLMHTEFEPGLDDFPVKMLGIDEFDFECASIPQGQAFQPSFKDDAGKIELQHALDISEEEIPMICTASDRSPQATFTNDPYLFAKSPPLATANNHPQIASAFLPHNQHVSEADPLAPLPASDGPAVGCEAMDTGHYLQIPDKFTPNVQCHSEAASWAIPSDSHVGYAGISAGHHHDLHASCIDHRLALNNSISNNTQRLRVSRLPRMRPTTRSGKFREALTIALVNRRLNRCNHLLCSGTYDDELVEPTLSLPTRFDEVRNSRASRDFPTIHRRIARHRPAFTAYSTPYAKNMFTLLKGRSDIISQGQIQSALVDP